MGHPVEQRRSRMPRGMRGAIAGRIVYRTAALLIPGVATAIGLRRLPADLMLWAADGFADGASLSSLWLVLFLFTIPSLSLTLYALDKWREQIEWMLLVHLDRGPVLPVGTALARGGRDRVRFRLPHPSPSSHLIFVFAGSFLMLMVAGILSQAGAPGWLVLSVPLAGLVAIYLASYLWTQRKIAGGRFDLVVDRKKQHVRLFAADGVPVVIELRHLRDVVVGPVAVDEGEGRVGTHYAVRLRRRTLTDVAVHVWEDAGDAELFAQALSEYSGIPVGRLS